MSIGVAVMVRGVSAVLPGFFNSANMNSDGKPEPLAIEDAR
jgi:hypothetical protein